jgi:two-component system KDP operon response regulator KdpE
MTSRETLVLVADTDASVADLVRRELQRRGMRVISATSSERALRVAQQQRPDLIILSLSLPGIPGLEVLRRLRANGPLPAILLTDGPSTSRATGRAGEALQKPFTGLELAERVAEALGGPPGHRGGRIAAGALDIDIEHRVVRHNGRELPLTRTEWALLVHLARHPGRTLSSAEILSGVWGPEYRDDLQFLRVWISRLRAKLGGEGFTIETVRGVGYVFQPDEPAARPRRRRAKVGVAAR